MIEAQRMASFAVCQVRAGRSLTQSLLNLWQHHPSLSSLQRAHAQELAYGTLRFYGELEQVLDALLQKPLHS
ncbi:MAG TPA: hypothetical protein VLL03_06185, partial [Burkholderiales bacterium]|nr:hypothetical protein [Burkholderiales bacterium]